MMLLFSLFIIVACWECGKFPISFNFSASAIPTQIPTTEMDKQSSPTQFPALYATPVGDYYFSCIYYISW